MVCRFKSNLVYIVNGGYTMKQKVIFSDKQLEFEKRLQGMLNEGWTLDHRTHNGFSYVALLIK
jgi:hypothetical protein